MWLLQILISKNLLEMVLFELPEGMKSNLTRVLKGFSENYIKQCFHTYHRCCNGCLRLWHTLHTATITVFILLTQSNTGRIHWTVSKSWKKQIETLTSAMTKASILLQSYMKTRFRLTKETVEGTIQLPPEWDFGPVLGMLEKEVQYLTIRSHNLARITSNHLSMNWESSSVSTCILTKHLYMAVRKIRKSLVCLLITSIVEQSVNFWKESLLWSVPNIK